MGAKFHIGAPCFLEEVIRDLLYERDIRQLVINILITAHGPVFPPEDILCRLWHRL